MKANEKRKMTKREKALAEASRAGRAQARLACLFRELVAKKMGLPSTHVVVIDYLLEKGSATAGELARITGLTTGAVTGVIERLEKGKYVKTERSPESDKRKVIIKPIDGKTSLHNHFYYPVVQKIHSVHGSYTNEEVELITMHHKKVAEIFQDAIEKLEKMDGKGK